MLMVTTSCQKPIPVACPYAALPGPLYDSFSYQMTTKDHLFLLYFREEIEALTNKCQELEEAKRQERETTVAVTHEVPWAMLFP